MNTPTQKVETVVKVDAIKIWNWATHWPHLISWALLAWQIIKQL